MSCHIPRVHEMSQSIPVKPVFPALPRLSSRGSIHTPVARGTPLWERLVGKPRGKASRESHSCFEQPEGKCDTAATAREKSARACPHSRGGLTTLGDSRNTPRSMSALERNPQVPAPTPHKVLGSGIDGRGIPRGPRATRMWTGLSGGHQSGSLRFPSYVESTCSNSRKSRMFSPPGEVRLLSAEASRA